MNEVGTLIGFGGPFDDYNLGATWIFHSMNVSSSLWVQQGEKLVLEGSFDSQQGYSVSLNSEGSVVAIGSPFDGEGSVSVWVSQANSWRYSTKLSIDDASSKSNVGAAISLNSQGNLLFIGSNMDDDLHGAVYQFSEILTNVPTKKPTKPRPTRKPTNPTASKPTTHAPSGKPTTRRPSKVPTALPTTLPTRLTTVSPTKIVTSNPSRLPTQIPSGGRALRPSRLYHL
jgi:hypothetical protein